jgi:hypothetical protein
VVYGHEKFAYEIEFLKKGAKRSGTGLIIKTYAMWRLTLSDACMAWQVSPEIYRVCTQQLKVFYHLKDVF